MAITEQPRRVDPEQEALSTDAVGLALLVVLDRLTPAERIAFVLHDMFDVPFADVASIVGRRPVAAKKLARQARTGVRGGTINHGEVTGVGGLHRAQLGFFDSDTRDYALYRGR